jgi:hypothetical protein
VNYFIGNEWGYYKYLRFLTPSFIFITGFMISNVYLSKYAVTDSRLRKRLFTRGFKLLAIFVALNLSRIVIGPVLGAGVVVKNMLDPSHMFAVFVSGNLPVGGEKLASFSILVPISYLLMFSGMLMLPFRLYRYTFHLVCLLLLLSIATLGWTGARSYNLEFIAIGLLGVVTGFTSIERINHVVRHSYLLALVYLCYVVAITFWDAPFLLLVVGVFLSVAVIYLAGASGSEFNSAGREVILLGKYSLFGYISQIAILQIMAVSFRRLNLGIAGLAISFLAAFALTVASVDVIDRARARLANVDRVYKALFA